MTHTLWYLLILYDFIFSSSSSSREGTAKDTDSISSGSDDSGTHVKNDDDKILTIPNSSMTLKNNNNNNNNNKVEVVGKIPTSTGNTATIKKPPRKSRLPEPVTHFSNNNSNTNNNNNINRHSYSGQDVGESSEYYQEESFQSPTRRFKKNSEIVQVSFTFSLFTFSFPFIFSTFIPHSHFRSPFNSILTLLKPSFIPSPII
jgi:hypothetical protein